MDKKTQEAILKWIVDNHQDHLAPGNVLDYDQVTDKENDCIWDEDPYVNSLELEKFILSLGVHESSGKV